MLPFKLSLGNFGKTIRSSEKIGTILAGVVMGGIVAVSSLPCNPGIFIVLGAAVLQGLVIWAVFLLMMYAIGFSIPLGAVLLGISLGKTALVARNADFAVRWFSGAILLIAGFYFLVTF
jgi:cytochrome c biogenesis protein CcdA